MDSSYRLSYRFVVDGRIGLVHRINLNGIVIDGFHGLIHFIDFNRFILMDAFIYSTDYLLMESLV